MTPPLGSANSARHLSHRSRRVAAAIALAVIVGGFLWIWLGIPDDDTIDQALTGRQFEQVVTMSQQRLRWFPNDWETRLDLGEAYQRLNRLDDALTAFAGIPESAGESAIMARIASASVLIHAGRLEEAERVLQQTETLEPGNEHVDALRLNIYLLTGQRWLSLAILHRQLRSPHPELKTLIYLANPDEVPAPPDDVFARMFQVADPLGLLGAAYTAAALGRNEQAHSLIQRALQQRADMIDAYLLEGMVLVDEDRLDEFDQLSERLPPSATERPAYWFNRGRAAHQRGDLPAAVRCYWEVLHLQPNHDRATYQLGQVLAAVGQRETADKVLARSRKLTRLVKLSIEIFSGQEDEHRLWECAELTHQLGRIAEAKAWCEILLKRNAFHQSARQLVFAMNRQWPTDTPLLLPDEDLSRMFPGREYPLPKSKSSPAPPTMVASTKAIRFVDDAPQAGLDFTYFSGDDPTTPGKRMFEYTGGGVAVLDYDRDGWPDLFFTQGSPYPGRLDQRTYTDQLYRNEIGTRWTSVAEAAQIADWGFGQGAAVGDYDDDGFPDLYLANVDGNRLFRNLGDGTFADVTAESGLGHRYWTTSCLLADFNADGVADVYDVTFLEGEDVYDRVCLGSDGVARSCAPAGFPAAPDQVYFGRGDGTFERASTDAGLSASDGDGLGIVLADLDQSGTTELFIGNDGRANFLFVPDDRQVPTARWKEVGVLSGVAFDEAGMAQATMGIAASDFNNDGLTDLFSTNFYMESNTLHVNLGSLSFSDRTRVYGLRESSLEMLGFGTQFLDADRDGWEDLIVTNGHVDDFDYKQIPYKMRCQFYENRGGRFHELKPGEPGPYFSEQRLGRGLALIDWNRDGRWDSAISNIGDPAALLTNQTASAGAAVNLQLIGWTRSRDAVGTRVIVTVGSRTLERQLTAGDGYQASNERRLMIGLGAIDDHATVRVDIIWPGGSQQTIENIEWRSPCIVREGRPPVMDLVGRNQ
jgi:tetratricopeptide (TPR) repeat protein